jgi:hypothetical protein
MDKFRAYRIDEQDGKIVAGFQELAIDDLRTRWPRPAPGRSCAGTR